MSNNKHRYEPKYKKRPVYNRGLIRKMLKFKLHSNKIKGAWHQLKGDTI